MQLEVVLSYVALVFSVMALTLAISRDYRKANEAYVDEKQREIENPNICPKNISGTHCVGWDSGVACCYCGSYNKEWEHPDKMKLNH